MKYAWIFAVIAGLAAGAWWWKRHGDRTAPGRSAAPTAGTGASTAGTGAGTGASAAGTGGPALPPRPLRVTPPPGASTAPPSGDPAESVPGPAAATGFAAEARDPAWAVDQERELRLRLDAVSADLGKRGAHAEVTAAECHRTQCLISVEAAGDKDLSALYGALETPEGLYGWADAVVLGEVTSDPATGKRTTAITVVFDRSL